MSLLLGKDKDTIPMSIESNFSEKLTSKRIDRIDIALLETQYEQLDKLTQKIILLTKKLNGHSYESLLILIKESKMSLEDVAALLKDITLSVFLIFSSKYMKGQSDENKKRSIQLEVLLVSLLETIPEMIKKIVRYENKNHKELKPRATISYNKNNKEESVHQLQSHKTDLFNSFSDSIGSLKIDEEDNTIQEIRVDLEKMKKSEGDICKYIETIIDCISQSQHEYFLVGIPSKSSSLNNTTFISGTNPWRVMCVFLVIIIVACFLGIPLYFIMKDAY